VTLDDLAAFDWVVGTPGSSRRSCFDRLFAGRRRPRARIETSSLPTIRLLLALSNRLTLLTFYELMYEEDTLAAVRYGPIEPVPCIGLTTRENLLPTQLLTSFIELVQKRIVGSLMPIKELARTSGQPAAKGRVKPIV
jgi:DNA-binding transcriptional LysR family regulator